MGMREIAELVRIEHSVMLVLGVITAIVLLDLQFTYVQLILLSLCPFLVSAGAFALNDYFDAESDRRNRKDRPIVRGDVSKQFALWLGISLLSLGALLAFPLGMHAFSIALVFAFLSVLYDWKLKDVALIGNSIIAASMAIVFIFTEVALAGTISQLTLLVCTASFLSGLGREIQKTVQDVEGDTKARKSMTLPVIIGKAASLHLSLVFIFAASLLGIYLYLSVPPLQNNALYIAPMALSIALLSYSSYLFYGDKKQNEKGRKISLYALMLGILAFLLGGL
ncbi:MAG: UbiA family prenyltransferase [Candidatus Micrarchaeota archaeon]|nr:UbiA family prenyltransferase [Candidatus Micrarchaeota archaeon]